MSSDEVGMGTWLDETELVYCPRCGSELEGYTPVRCPEHGPLSVDYWELTEGDVALAEEIEDEFAGLGEQVGDAIAEAFEEQADEIEEQARSKEPGTPADDGQPLRDRINRFIGRDR